MMTRTIQTECSNCGGEMEVDINNDVGADAWSVHQRDTFCSWECEGAGY